MAENEPWDLEKSLSCYDEETLEELAQPQGYLNHEDLERDGVVVALDDLRTPLALAMHVLIGRQENEPCWHEVWAEGFERLAADLIQRCAKLEGKLATLRQPVPQTG